jgi:type IV secretory pathway component VirB8
MKTTTTKKWTEQSIIELLNSSDKAVTRAVIAIYKRQTEDEKVTHDTKHTNGIGFNSADARLLSYCAQYAQKNNCDLSGKYLTTARKRIVKYRKQLLQIANAGE